MQSVSSLFKLPYLLLTGLVFSVSYSVTKKKAKQYLTPSSSLQAKRETSTL